MIAKDFSGCKIVENDGLLSRLLAAASLPGDVGEPHLGRRDSLDEHDGVSPEAKTSEGETERLPGGAVQRAEFAEAVRQGVGGPSAPR